MLQDIESIFDFRDRTVDTYHTRQATSKGVMNQKQSGVGMQRFQGSLIDYVLKLTVECIGILVC